jgi:hypothetical protein
MNRINPDVDVVRDVLKAVLAEHPNSSFVLSLLNQYEERGGLSKRQLEGLYGKAQQVKSLPANKLATLEAIIKKKPRKYRSSLPETQPMFTKDARTGEMMLAILARYPQHKRVLFLKSRYDDNIPLTPAELAELEKFNKLLSQ